MNLTNALRTGKTFPIRFSTLFIIPIMLFMLMCCITLSVKGQPGGNPSLSTTTFRTKKAGLFSDASTWEYDNDNNFVPATSAPGVADDIQVYHTLTLDRNYSVNYSSTFTILSGGMIINPGITFAVDDGLADFRDLPVVLKSNATATASIGQINQIIGGLTGATNVTVERFIPAKRAWRLITAPLMGTNNTSIFSNWQTSQTGTGVTIFSPDGTGASGNGILKGGKASSILTYNSTDNTWSAVTDTKNTLLFGGSEGKNNSYAVFVTGSYSSNNIGGAAQATTLRPTGTLQIGTVTINQLTANQFHLIGNPYASPIKVNNVGANTNGAIYVWDAKGDGFGTYRTWDSQEKWIDNNITVGSSYGNDAIIQSGQAFFVRAGASGSASVTFNETDKVINNQNNVSFRIPASGISNAQRLRIELSRIANNEVASRDVAIIRCEPSFNALVDDHDIIKMANLSENISIHSNKTDLVIERRPVLSATDTIYLRTWNMEVAEYHLGIGFENIPMTANLIPVLQDLALNTEKVLKSNEANNISFTVNKSNLNTDHRFRIVMRVRPEIPVASSAPVKKFTLFPNPVVNQTKLQLSFQNFAEGNYFVNVYSITGVRLQQNIIHHQGGTSTYPLSMNNQIHAGNYLIEVSNEAGEKNQMKFIVY